MVKVRVLRTFAISGQGIAKEGETIELIVSKQSSILVLHPNRYEELLREGKIELLSEQEDNDG